MNSLCQRIILTLYYYLATDHLFSNIKKNDMEVNNIGWQYWSINCTLFFSQNKYRMWLTAAEGGPKANFPIAVMSYDTSRLVEGTTTVFTNFSSTPWLWFELSLEVLKFESTCLCTSCFVIINSYSSRTCRIWADIYNQRGRRPSWLLSAHIRQVREE